MSDLSCAVVDLIFPADTADANFVFTATEAGGAVVTGSGSAPTMTMTLTPGTWTGVVSKTVNGSVISSLPSAPLVIAAPATVTLSVPDAGSAATLV